MKVKIFAAPNVRGKIMQKHKRLRYEAEVANEDEALAVFHRYCLKMDKPWHLAEAVTVKSSLDRTWRFCRSVEAYPEIEP
jgi:hypothetical protein